MSPFARAGMSHPFGKLVSEVKFRMPEATKEICLQRAHGLGMTLAEYVREVMVCHAHGADMVRSMHIRRVELCAQTGFEKDS